MEVLLFGIALYWLLNHDQDGSTSSGGSGSGSGSGGSGSGGSGSGGSGAADQDQEGWSSAGAPNKCGYQVMRYRLKRAGDSRGWEYTYALFYNGQPYVCPPPTKYPVATTLDGTPFTAFGDQSKGLKAAQDKADELCDDGFGFDDLIPDSWPFGSRSTRSNDQESVPQPETKIVRRSLDQSNTMIDYSLGDIYSGRDY